MTTMCEYTPSHYALPHWKCVLYFCANFQHNYPPSQEIGNHHSNIYLMMHFHIYHLTVWCLVHERRPLDENKNKIAYVSVILILYHPQKYIKEKSVL